MRKNSDTVLVSTVLECRLMPYTLSERGLLLIYQPGEMERWDGPDGWL